MLTLHIIRHAKTEQVAAPDAERALFFYARDNFGGANNWDLEVAFVSDDGQWDSKFGANYRFTFAR